MAKKRERDLLGQIKTDVALLKIEGNNFPYLQFGDSDKALMGELVMALGNPFSVGVTFTTGVISAKDEMQLVLTLMKTLYKLMQL